MTPGIFSRVPEDFLRVPEDFVRVPEDFLRVPEDFLRVPGECARGVPGSVPGECPKIFVNSFSFIIGKIKYNKKIPGHTPGALPGHTPRALPGHTPWALPGNTPGALSRAFPQTPPQTHRTCDPAFNRISCSMRRIAFGGARIFFPELRVKLGCSAFVYGHSLPPPPLVWTIQPQRTGTTGTQVAISDKIKMGETLFYP